MSKMEDLIAQVKKLNEEYLKILNTDDALFKNIEQRIQKIEKRLDRLEKKGMDDGK